VNDFNIDTIIDQLMEKLLSTIDGLYKNENWWFQSLLHHLSNGDEFSVLTSNKEQLLLNGFRGCVPIQKYNNESM
jgi:hypothetical protein